MANTNQNETVYEDIVAAANRIKLHAHVTPVVTNRTINKLVGREIYFKCENLQKTGSCKGRGALNAVLKHVEENPNTPGVVGYSSGNHATALSWSSSIAGIKCKVVVPKIAPKVKIEAIREYGGDIVFCESTSPLCREDAKDKIVAETGMTFLPPFDHYDVIAGQGTMALELFEQIHELDAILVPISGGGMLSGISIVKDKVRPECKVFAVEPKGKELEPCLRAEERLWSNPPQFVNTVADGIRVQQAGKLTFPIMCRRVEKDVFTVTNEEIIDAMKFFWMREKLVVETTSAAAIAAAMSDKMKNMDPSIKKVAVILCGGNVDLDNLPWVNTSQNNNI